MRSRPVTPRSARPSVSGPELAAKLPPVLFRLPALAPSPPGVERLAPVTDQASLARGAQAAEMRDIPESVTETACAQDDTTEPAYPPQVTLETFGGQSNSVSENAPTTETSSTCATPVDAPVVAAPVTVANSVLQRTWWEHWSSGVVLILLIIALVTASIIALNDSGGAKPDYLASQAESSVGDEFDLSSITIPEITIPSTPSRNSNGISTAPLPKDKETADEARNLATISTPAVAAPIALAPQATLDQPVGVAAPQLFVDDVSLGNAAQSNAGLAIPSLTTSSPAVSLELPNTVSPADSGKTATDGSSPTFYDGASRTMEQHAASGNAVGQAWPTETGATNLPGEGLVHSAEGPIDTNMPSYPTILASATGQASGAPPRSVFSTASHAQTAGPSAALGVPSSDAAAAIQGTSQHASPAPTATVVPSATPDLNGNSLVSEYFKFKQMRQAAEATAENRFPSSTPVATQPNAAPLSIGSGSGFTLGNPQAGTPVAPPLPR